MIASVEPAGRYGLLAHEGHIHMRVELRLYATLRRFARSAAAGVIIADIPEGGTVADVIAELGINADEVHISMVNGVSSPLSQVLAEGDRLGLFPAVGGG